ncbi:MAG: ribosome small subunit-dependent GTPase A [Alistipes sp.]|jgi:ribosome biogenesis GTPase|nr:ribosome small subunit-dependent GTPase A [Alistipes sp.]
MNQSIDKAQERVEGIVTSSTGSWYEVVTDMGVLTCRIRGRLRLKGIRSTNPVVVGDRVMVEPDGESSAIVEILPRRNYVIRRASNLSKESHIIAANIDRALLIVTLHSPSTPKEFVDRFLVTCEAYKVPVTIVLGKADTLEGEYAAEAEEFEAIYTNAGYEVLRLSSTTGDGVEQIRQLLHNNTTLVAGNSGVGKSTLVSHIDPTLDIRTGEISESHHKGKHTTTFSTMYPIEGGYIIDTPGIKGFGLIDIDSRELCRYFPDMMRLAPDCKFYNCTHIHEPGCAVREAVEQGEVPWSRYESYLKILDEDDKYRK